jgi:hypothetical protein
VNPPTEQFPEGTVTIRLHRRKPQHIIMDRRDVNVVLAEELEMQRTENKHLKTKLGQQARYIVRLEDAMTKIGGLLDYWGNSGKPDMCGKLFRAIEDVLEAVKNETNPRPDKG